MDQTLNKKNSTQQSWTAVEVNSNGKAVLTDLNVLELLYQDKIDNAAHCIVKDTDDIKKYKQFVDINRDNFTTFNTTNDNVDRDGFDQSNRENWFIPQSYKDLDIEAYVLGLCKTDQEKERVNFELDLYKNFAMIDVLKCLKYIIDTLREKKLVWGVGRGSSVASYVLYLIGVHKVNSIKFDLNPEEFLR